MDEGTLEVEARCGDLEERGEDGVGRAQQQAQAGHDRDGEQEAPRHCRGLPLAGGSRSVGHGGVGARRQAGPAAAPAVAAVADQDLADLDGLDHAGRRGHDPGHRRPPGQAGERLPDRRDAGPGRGRQGEEADDGDPVEDHDPRAGAHRQATGQHEGDGGEDPRLRRPVPPGGQHAEGGDREGDGRPQADPATAETEVDGEPAGDDGRHRDPSPAHLLPRGGRRRASRWGRPLPQVEGRPHLMGHVPGRYAGDGSPSGRSAG